MKKQMPKIHSPHESHRPIKLKNFFVVSVVNFGNTAAMSEGLVINQPSAVSRIRDKIEMKRWFDVAKVSHAKYVIGDGRRLNTDGVVKERYHDKRFMRRAEPGDTVGSIFHGAGKEPNDLYIEEFVPFHREFRVHASRRGIFCATEKELKYEREGQWVKNKSNCKFKKEFPKQEGWKEMEKACRRILRVCQLDFAGFDVGFFGSRYYIIEANSACGMGEYTRKAYERELNRIIGRKQWGYLFSQIFKPKNK